MQCNRCKSEMERTETQADGRTEQSHYRCPVCGRQQMHTKKVALWAEPAFAVGMGRSRAF